VPRGGGPRAAAKGNRGPSYGPAHPNVAREQNNLALLLQATNHLAEAQPLAHRSLAIYHHLKLGTGQVHPNWDVAIANYRGLLNALDLTECEIAEQLREFTT
jgi:hypothetical protein